MIPKGVARKGWYHFGRATGELLFLEAEGAVKKDGVVTGVIGCGGFRSSVDVKYGGNVASGSAGNHTGAGVECFFFVIGSREIILEKVAKIIKGLDMGERILEDDVGGNFKRTQRIKVDAKGPC